MRRALCAGLLIFAAVAVTTAQDRPDFSGTWLLVSPNPAPSNAPQALVVEAVFRRQSVRGEVWSLDRQGTLSIAVTDHIVGDPSTTATLVYRRQP